MSFTIILLTLRKRATAEQDRNDPARVYGTITLSLERLQKPMGQSAHFKIIGKPRPERIRSGGSPMEQAFGMQMTQMAKAILLKASHPLCFSAARQPHRARSAAVRAP